MAINFLGTWEQKENKTGNTGTNTYFREHQNRINTFRELTWEHKENFVGNREGLHIRHAFMEKHYLYQTVL